MEMVHFFTWWNGFNGFNGFGIFRSGGKGNGAVFTKTGYACFLSII